MEQERLIVNEAAQRLGISAEAVRQRIARGTLRSEKIEDRVYVVLTSSDADQAEQSNGNRTASERSSERELVEQLRRENERLWRELETRDEEIRRRDVLLKDALDWRAALPEHVGTRSTAAPTEHEESQKRSWWSRLVG